MIQRILVLISILAVFAKFLGLEAATYSYHLALSPIYLIVFYTIAKVIFSAIVIYLFEKSIKNKVDESINTESKWRYKT